MRAGWRSGDGCVPAARTGRRLSTAVTIIGCGPAGLMAAEAAAARGHHVQMFDAMPSVGRKFLMAGKSGLNLTHFEPFELFLSRFGASAVRLAPILAAFAPDDVRRWTAGLGIETFVGSSGRVFPVDFKAAPLLRAWVRRLRAQGVIFHVRHRWRGWDGAGNAVFDTPGGIVPARASALVLALGGASWPRLGSDGAWIEILAGRKIRITPLKPANCGFDVPWSDHFRDRFAGQPVKPVVVTSAAGSLRGEFVISVSGIEGSGIYPHAAALRDRIADAGKAVLILDLLPDHTLDRLLADLGRPRASRSLSEHLRRATGLTGVKAGLLRECLPSDAFSNPARLARGIKALAVSLSGPRPIAEAISSAGGIAWDALDDDLMLRSIPGVFAAGEMIDWEVTTGGYLLNACMALGRRAGESAAAWASRGG